MVTLLMRSPEKLSMANADHAKAASGEVRSRARKGRNAHKKQPQRGLGVAQLEKLRLQEQSKLEAACYASFQHVPPSYGFADQTNSGICFRPVKPPPPSVHSYNSENLHYLPVEDGEMLRSIISLANSDHSTAGSFTARLAQENVALRLPRGRDTVDQSLGGSSLRTLPSVASLPERAVQRSYVEDCSSAGKRLQVACAGSPASPTAKSSSLFSSGVHRVNSLASNVDDQVPAHGTRDGDAKNGARPRFTSNSLQCFESSSGPAKLRRLSQDRTELLPVVGLAINFGRPKELSSFQSFSSNNTWLATEKICGQKRPWTDLKVSTSKLMHSESLDLNATVGEVDVAQDAGVANAPESPVGVHDTPGVSRSGLGYTLPLLKDKACASWQEAEVHNLSTTTDVGFHSGESLKVSCPSQSRIKDCCSSVCSPCGSPVTRRRCLSSPEAQALVAVERETSSDFLTLGISSRAYPTSPQYEVSSKESLSPDMVRQVKRVLNAEADAENSLHFQMSNRLQESAPSVTGGANSPSCTDNSFFSAVGLSCRFTSTSSSNVTEDCHQQTGRGEMREFLDLRLKLAL